MSTRAAEASHEDGQLAEDLNRYVAHALELGATDAGVIRASDIVVDERVRAKCRYPTCPSYNTTVNCPPHTMSIEETRVLLGRYRYGVIAKIDVTTGRLEDFDRATRRTLMDIVWKLESEAFYDGHYLAVGFGGTNCKEVLCRTLECSALAGGGCRHPLKARPGMHGVGIDVFATAGRMGWKLVPAGSSCDLSSLPCLSTIGLVLID